MNADALRALDYIHNTDVDNPVDLAGKMRINTRYARELIGLLHHDGLVTESGFGGWTTTFEGRAALQLDTLASGVVDLPQNAHTGHQPKENPMTSTKSDKVQSKPVELRKCSCGCGEIVAGKSKFRQGHDARMVSQLVAAVVGAGITAANGTFKGATPVVPPAFNAVDAKMVVGNEDIQARINTATDAVAGLFGDKLAAKFNGAAMSGWAKYDKPERAPRAAKAAVEAKVGRWTKSGKVVKGEFVYTDAKGVEVRVAKGKYTLV